MVEQPLRLCNDYWRAIIHFEKPSTVAALFIQFLSGSKLIASVHLTTEILYLGLIQVPSAILSLYFKIWFQESNLTYKKLVAVLCFPQLQLVKKSALETIFRVLTMFLFLLGAVLRTMGLFHAFLFWWPFNIFWWTIGLFFFVTFCLGVL